MTLRVAQFSLKIAHLSFSMVLRGPRACGLRPRLWLLMFPVLYNFKEKKREKVEVEGGGGMILTTLADLSLNTA